MPPTKTMGKAVGPSSEELRRIRDLELELKRMSGKISCSDCRRLKLKCDKKIPCSSCTRRGAESLCPLGAVRGSSGQESRIALSSSSHHYSQLLTRKLTLLSERIRALEDALALESEARGGSGSHPLLAENHLLIKQLVEDDEDEAVEEEDQGDHMLSAFGTLTIDESRTMRYLGPAASESALLMEVLESASPPAITASSIATSSDSLSPEILHSSRSFPFPPSLLGQNEHSLLAQLVTYIPSFERATALYEAFFRNLSWFGAPVERSHFVSEIIPVFYPRRKRILPTNIREEHAHDLAFLFILFACGSVGDLTQNPINDEAERYYTLAEATMSVRSIMHGASLTGVQTLFLLGAYDVYSGRKSNQEDARKMMAFGSCMAAAIGLHRDPSRWGFEPKIVDRRRRIFWEIYSIDTWRSLESGRPTIFRPNVVDCELPNDQFATLDENGEVIESVPHWRYRFLRDIVVHICEKVSSSKPLKYRDILELDRKIRNFSVHPFAKRYQPHADGLGIDAEFHRIYPLISSWDREEALMYIHRNFFARAILDFPDNPMRSPFAASFLTAYRSATTILRLCRENMEQMYLTVLRVWQLWSLCLTCGVIVGAVASLGPSVSFSSSAFVELECAISLFKKYSEHKIARHGISLLQRIREKAVSALSQPRTRPTTMDNQPECNIEIPTIRSGYETVDEGLFILRGTTRVVEKRSVTSLGAPTNSSQSSDIGRAARQTTVEDFEGTPLHPDIHFQGHAIAAQSGQNPFEKHNSENVRLDNIPIERTETLHTPGLDAWLAELERLLGSSIGQRKPDGGVGDQQQGQASEQLDNYPGPSVMMPDLSSSTTAAASVSNSQVPGDSTMVMPDTYLEQAVSTEDWRVFIQQSGLSSTPPFDFSLDSAAPMTDTSQNWRSEMPMFT